MKFGKKSIAERIAHELEEARHDRLHVRSKLEYYKHMTAMMDERIMRLEREQRQVIDATSEPV